MAKAKIATITAAEVPSLVDQIGELKAQLAPKLQELEDQLDKLKALGPDRYVGERFEVNVFDADRNTLDMDAVREKLSPQFITAHTSTKTVRTAKVTARMLPSVQ